MMECQKKTGKKLTKVVKIYIYTQIQENIVDAKSQTSPLKEKGATKICPIFHEIKSLKICSN